jgi:hypothetical protein
VRPLEPPAGAGKQEALAVPLGRNESVSTALPPSVLGAGNRAVLWDHSRFYDYKLRMPPPEALTPTNWGCTPETLDFT